MAIKANKSGNAEKSPIEWYFGCGISLLAAIIIAAIPRFFHALLIPQVLQENAYFIEKSPYILMYLFSVPAGLILGFTTYFAKIEAKTRPKLAASNLSLVGTGGILLSCYIFYKGFELTDPILKQNSLFYILAANLPWIAPIFLWSVFLLFWSFKIRMQSH